MKVNVKQLTGPQFYVEVEPNSTVSQLKEKIAESTDIAVVSQRLIYSGREMIDEHLIEHYNLEEGKTVHLVTRKQLSSTTPTASLSHGTSNVTVTTSTNDMYSNDMIDIERQERQPLQSDNQSENNDIVVDDNGNFVDVMEVARMCRLIRLFAIIDCILMIIFAFWGDLLFLCGVPLAICGYFGAKSLKRGPLFIYGIFILLSIAFRIYLAYLYSSWLMILLTVVSVLLELYIFKQTITVFSIIPQLTANDRRILNQLSDLFI